MNNPELLTFTFIVSFRGGTYCSQIQAKNITKSTIEWVLKIKTEQNQIKYLGDKIIEELKIICKDEDYKPIPLAGLKNIWCTGYPTKQGVFSINIIQTDTTLR